MRWEDVKAKLLAERDLFRRRQLFLAWLTAEVPAAFAVVGGMAVDAYTGGQYGTMDIDLVARNEVAVQDVLKRSGFQREGRHWVLPELQIYVEFPSGPLAGDWERLSRLETPLGPFSVLGVEDLIIDRLNACVHWKSMADCQWAAFLVNRYRSRLDEAYLRRHAAVANVQDALEDLLGETP